VPGGIAITFVDSTNGQWQYSTGKNKWVTISGVSATAALLLDANDRLRFVPKTGFVGTATIRYRGWDQSAGESGDRVNIAPLNSFSAFEETAAVAVMP
jgi:hypothetical protein